MLFLVLGKGKTGSLVADVARERGHIVRAFDITENQGASALTAPTRAGPGRAHRCRHHRLVHPFG